MTLQHDGVTPTTPGVVRGVWNDRRASPDERARALLDEMTLEEKVGQLGSIWFTDAAGDFAPSVEGSDDSASPASPTTGDFTGGLGQLTRIFGTEPVTVAEGVDRLRERQRQVVAGNRFGIPAIAHEECLTGFAAYGATAFPTPLAWAASFDEDLVERMAEAIGDDLRSVGVHQGLAPVLDVVRDYRWGRVEETLGEDPYLVGQLGAAYVRGLERAGIVATLKHFAGYAASRGAKNHAPVSMGRRELADVVLPPFETAIRLGGARSVMNAYTDLDGVPAGASVELLTGILRDDWGFDGTVVADYWAIPFLATMHHVANDATAAGALALTAGIDVELPETAGYGAGLVGLVQDGTLDERLVDRAVLRHLRQKIELGLLDGVPLVPEDAGSTDLDGPRNRAIATRLAEESVVLLRNREVLPLQAPTRIAVIGPAADQFRSLVGCYAFPNHVLSKHPGHDLGIAIPTILDAVRAEFPAADVVVEPGCSITDTGQDDVPAAVEAARAADVVVLAVGDIAGLFGDGTSGEGCDAEDLRLPGGQHDLVLAVLATGTPVVLTVLSGRPYALGDYDRADALVQAFFPGQEGATAVAGLLSGRVQPSGRLPVQIPHSPAMPSTYLQPPLGLASRGISVLDPSPLFPFGHGLTAGDVRYRSLTSAAKLAVDGEVLVDVTVENVGVDDAVEVIQLYGTDPVASVVRPSVELLAFARLTVATGTSATVRFSVSADRLSFTGVDGRRVVEPGTYVLSAGPSALDRPLTHTIEVTGSRRELVGPRELRVDWRRVAPREA
ncbi:glycoside hydrolase family 3 N-terminal domain-containing protein [Plantibacter sp. ME-Dv--P-122b]|uniref:beta-glucosidase family protein n=1 Tax=Plantibacter sp. ME-Dv--P-122b TaxID=3040300 RepID=UPI00254C49C0|nr:glycoside hydrolase family 3 N-terminal domain-containing protein [Plantibacter sp. ME-Dv--P-122b]